MLKIFQTILLQMTALGKDALLFPDKVEERTLSKMPPTIIWEAEFDLFLTEAYSFANRL